MYNSKQTYLDTLRNVPDGIILNAAGKTFDLNHPDRCICGWVLREAIAALKDIPVRAVSVTTMSRATVPEQCSRIFGGTVAEWDAIYHGVTDPTRVKVIENAFYERVREAY